MRRILRIWPVYFLGIIISLILAVTGIIELPERWEMSILLYIFLMANVALVLGIPLRPITPFWSISVEEQFYLIWPWVISLSKSLPITLIIILISYVALKTVIWLVDPFGGAYALISITKISSMTVGAFGAWAYYNSKISMWLYSPVVQIVIVVLIILFPITNFDVMAGLDSEVKAILFAILILNMSTNPSNLLRIRNKVLRWLGDRSYGIYCYHMIIILILGFVFSGSQISYSIVFVSALVTFLTVVVSHLSYELVESPILQLKKKFS